MKNLALINIIFVFIAFHCQALPIHAIRLYENVCQDSFKAEIHLDVPKDSTKFRHRPYYMSEYEDYYKFKNLIKFTPLKLLNFAYPTLEIGYERKTGIRFSTEIKAGYILPNSMAGLLDNEKPNNKGFTFSLEEKYFLKPPKRNRPYIAFEFNYRRISYNAINSFAYPNEEPDSIYPPPSYVDSFSIKKQVFNYTLKYGLQTQYKRFFIDLYVGLGLRRREVRHFDRNNPIDEFLYFRKINFYNLIAEKGFSFQPTLALNIRLGFRF